MVSGATAMLDTSDRISAGSGAAGSSGDESVGDEALSRAATREARSASSVCASDSTHAPTSDAGAMPTQRSSARAISRAVA